MRTVGNRAVCRREKNQQLVLIYLHSHRHRHRHHRQWPSASSSSQQPNHYCPVQTHKFNLWLRCVKMSPSRSTENCPIYRAKVRRRKKLSNHSGLLLGNPGIQRNSAAEWLCANKAFKFWHRNSSRAAMYISTYKRAKSGPWNSTTNSTTFWLFLFEVDTKRHGVRGDN